VLVELDEEPMEQVEGLIRMGCFGCLNTEASTFEAQLAVQSVRFGEIWASRKLVSHILRSMQRETEKLTSREQEIVTLMSGGLTNDEIANRLFISGQTVRWHLRRLYKKLGTHDRRSLKLNGLLAEHAAHPTRRSASPEQTLIRSVSADPQNNQRAFTSVPDSLLGRLTK
jgi:DNA-binding NarL/FixJ family response regulator